MNYIITTKSHDQNDSNELTHYGVVGMRWGVRRGTKRLSSSDSGKREKAVASLNKHREKGIAKIDKLKAKGVKLEKKHEKRVIKDETKAAKLNQKATKQRKKAYGMFVSEKRAVKRLGKAAVLESKANALTAKANNAKAKINKNRAMISAFEREVGNIDRALVSNGKQYMG